MSDAEARKERARRRAGWPVSVATLATDADAEDLRETTTAVERVLMVWRLTQDAWALTGKPLPEYDRRNMPGRVIRARRP
jgi:hypothetical protein